ncbi:SemiSWEET family sugar transporter [Phenylobacterium aquaticum]|uniref:SemiSWEET family sugar transporter n=1 Tax=Phenylobacterium aquaticum TaxID=1763816 RepID=UPI0034CF5C2E
MRARARFRRVSAANLIGTLAALCSMASFAPQIAKILAERDASAVSLRTYVVMVAGFSLWIAYGLMTSSWPVAASNGVCLMLSGAILVLKLRFSANGAARGDLDPAMASPYASERARKALSPGEGSHGQSTAAGSGPDRGGSAGRGD